MHLLLLSIPLLAALGSCSSPPKPPSVDDSQKRPANSMTAIELQACKSALHNTRILANESTRLAESADAAVTRLAQRPVAVTAVPLPPPPNAVFSVLFAFGSTRVAVPADIESGLLEQAQSAPLLLLRGRTDGGSDSLVESRIARGRAAAVRDYLIRAGIDPARIRTTYQPVGDNVADNSVPIGRAMNRRVEIEVYRATPVTVAAIAGEAP